MSQCYNVNTQIVLPIMQQPDANDKVIWVEVMIMLSHIYVCWMCAPLVSAEHILEIWWIQCLIGVNQGNFRAQLECLISI